MIISFRCGDYVTCSDGKPSFSFRSRRSGQLQRRTGQSVSQAKYLVRELLLPVLNIVECLFTISLLDCSSDIS